MANVDIQLGYKDSAWFTANATLVLKAGQTVHLQQTGTYKIGDGTTQLSALLFLGGTATSTDLIVATVVNKTGVNLLAANYQAVKISTAQGQRLAVDFAQANNDINSTDTIGLIAQNINVNQEGLINILGQLLEINTTGSLQGETWADGDVLYLSTTVAGKVTNIKPTGLTGHLVVLGYVEYAHAVHGKIYVKITNGFELDELHNVYINQTTLANNDVLTYESSSQLWKNKQSNYLQIVSKDITDSSALTGTTAITLMKSVLIPANTYTTGDTINILSRAIRNTATGGAINYMYINTTNSLTGATLVGTMSGSFSFYGMERSLYIKSATNSETFNATASAAGSEVTTGLNGASNLNINWAVNQYVIAAFQNPVVGNSTVMSSLIIQKY
jgi:hypothetical protein